MTADTDSDVTVKWRTPTVTLASVRTGDGIFDIHHGPLTGWTCSCLELGCTHLVAVRQMAGEAIGGGDIAAP
ncbi:MAG: hypothetical protein ACLP62_11255 [Acidimicrobiales bacterium]